MSQNLKTLLHIAAEMRAVGHSWQAVAEKLQRKTKTCQSWPIKHRAQWEPLYFEIQKHHFDQINQECKSHMHGLMRSEDPKLRQKANESWMKYSGKAFGMASVVNQPVEKPKTANERIMDGVLEDMNDTRERLNRKRAIQGLPPLTDDEFMWAWGGEGGTELPSVPTGRTDLQSVPIGRTDLQSVPTGRTDLQSVPPGPDGLPIRPTSGEDGLPIRPTCGEDGLQIRPTTLVLIVLAFLFVWATRDRSLHGPRGPDVQFARTFGDAVADQDMHGVFQKKTWPEGRFIDRKTTDVGLIPHAEHEHGRDVEEVRIVFEQIVVGAGAFDPGAEHDLVAADRHFHGCHQPGERLTEDVVVPAIAARLERRAEIDMAGAPAPTDIEADAEIGIPRIENESRTSQEPIAAETDACGGSVQHFHGDRLGAKRNDVELASLVPRVHHVRINHPRRIARWIEELRPHADLTAPALLNVVNQQPSAGRGIHTETDINFLADGPVRSHRPAAIVIRLKQVIPDVRSRGVGLHFFRTAGQDRRGGGRCIGPGNGSGGRRNAGCWRRLVRHGHDGGVRNRRAAEPTRVPPGRAAAMGGGSESWEGLPTGVCATAAKGPAKTIAVVHQRRNPRMICLTGRGWTASQRCSGPLLHIGYELGKL